MIVFLESDTDHGIMGRYFIFFMLKKLQRYLLVALTAICIMTVMTLSVVKHLIPIVKDTNLRQQGFTHIKSIQTPLNIVIYNTGDRSSYKMVKTFILARFPNSKINEIDVTDIDIPKAQSFSCKDFVKTRPDLVISYSPLVQQELLAAIKELSIPFFTITTDEDLESFKKSLDQSLVK